MTTSKEFRAQAAAIEVASDRPPQRCPGAQLTKVEARSLVKQVHVHGDKFVVAMRELFEARAHLIYGHKTWQAFVDVEFPNLPRVPMAKRKEAVAELSGAGMSTRDIASVVGVSKSQVAEEIKGLKGCPDLDTELTFSASRKARRAASTLVTLLEDLATAADLTRGQELDLLLVDLKAIAKLSVDLAAKVAQVRAA